MAKKQMTAIIDLGSLSLRLKIFEVASKEYPKEIESVRRFLSLGAQTYRNGLISGEQVTELCDILSGYVIKIKEYRIKDVLCVATSAFREAQNRDFVVEQIRLRTGLSVRILDNAEERYFHNIAVKELMNGFDKIIQNGTLILDIGAGSIQATVYDKSDFVFSQNMLLGSLRISELLSDLERQTTHYARVLEEFISHGLEDYHAVEPKGTNYQNMIAFGSDIGFIKDLSGLSPREYCFLPKKRFLETYDFLLKTSPTDLVLSKNIPSATASLLLPTAMIIKESLEYTGLEGIHMPAASLCDGIMYQCAWANFGFKLRMDPTQDTISAARHIGKRYRYDKKHTEQVERHALQIFDSTRRQNGLDDRSRLLLQLTAILHEVGKYIQVSSHSESSFNIVHATEIIGLDHVERDIIAYTVCYYMQADLFADPDYTNLPSDLRKTVSKLTAILRLADAMDASHKQKLRNISIVSLADSLHISCDTTEDLTYEIWDFDIKKELFFEVFGAKPVLKPRRPTQ
jgi:exopolyphosphatase/guanosine-5'-triphosphate,3'-diphosphate pyrophosphatase